MEGRSRDLIAALPATPSRLSVMMIRSVATLTRRVRRMPPPPDPTDAEDWLIGVFAQCRYRSMKARVSRDVPSVRDPSRRSSRVAKLGKKYFARPESNRTERVEPERSAIRSEE